MTTDKSNAGSTKTDGSRPRKLDFDNQGPYVPANESPLEFSIKAVLLGLAFGLLIGSGMKRNASRNEPSASFRSPWLR